MSRLELGAGSILVTRGDEIELEMRHRIRAGMLTAEGLMLSSYRRPASQRSCHVVSGPQATALSGLAGVNIEQKVVLGQRGEADDVGKGGNGCGGHVPSSVVDNGEARSAPGPLK